jgi:hypothetical protein
MLQPHPQAHTGALHAAAAMQVRDIHSGPPHPLDRVVLCARDFIHVSFIYVPSISTRFIQI